MKRRFILLYLMVLVSLLPLPAYGQFDDPNAVPLDYTYNGWTITYDSAFFGTVSGELRPAESETPEGNRDWTGTPEITAFTFSDAAVTQDIPAEIILFSTERLQAGTQSPLMQMPYAGMLTHLDAFHRARGSGALLPDLPTVTNFNDPALLELPNLPMNGALTFAVRPHYVVGGDVQGIAYVTMPITSGIQPVTNERLRYVFQGLTADGSTYISASLPISAPDLPNSDSEAGQLPDAQAINAQAISSAEELQHVRPQDFTPSLDTYDQMILTLRRTAPTADATTPDATPQANVSSPSTQSRTAPQFASVPPALDYETTFDATFSESGITFDYNSAYYGEIRMEEIASDIDTIGLGALRRVEIFVSPLGTSATMPTIDIFSTEPFEAGVVDAALQAQYNALIGFMSGYAESIAAGNSLPSLPQFLNIDGTFENLPFIAPDAYHYVFSLKPGYVIGENVWGIRYVTLRTTGGYEVAGDQLAYAFQGLTTDGEYYISALFPITSFAVPEYSTEGETGASSSLNAERIQALDAAPDSDFFPSFNELDAMLASLRME